MRKGSDRSWSAVYVTILIVVDKRLEIVHDLGHHLFRLEGMLYDEQRRDDEHQPVEVHLRDTLVTELTTVDFTHVADQGQPTSFISHMSKDDSCNMTSYLICRHRTSFRVWLRIIIYVMCQTHSDHGAKI